MWDGSHGRGVPVGVRTVELDSASRSIPVELWYPAPEEFRGRDRDPAQMDRYRIHPENRARLRQSAVRDAPVRDGRFPLAIFSHGFSSHRRNATYLTCALAASGYIVAAPEHLGTSTIDCVPAEGTSDAEFTRVTEARLCDVRALLDALLTRRDEPLSGAVKRGGAVVFGHSLGGHTALLSAARFDEVVACAALAPSGGRDGHEGERLGRILEREIDAIGAPTLFVLAADDSFVPAAGIREIFASLVSDRRLLEVGNSDHMIFVDQCRRAHELARTLPLDSLRVNAPFKAPRPFADLLAEADGYWAVTAALSALLRGTFAPSGYAFSEIDGPLLDEAARRGLELTLEAVSTSSMRRAAAL